MAMFRIVQPTLCALVIAILLISQGRADSIEAAADFFAQVKTLTNADGAFIAMRHALAPGTGDPTDFVLDECQSQRNLDARGRQQAAEIGALFRANGFQEVSVFSSQWCRCLETARLLDVGEVKPLESLNSFFNNRAQGPDQTRALRQWLESRPPNPVPPVLVTHQVNITALTGVYPASGELVLGRIAASGELEVVARLITNVTSQE